MAGWPAVSCSPCSWAAKCAGRSYPDGMKRLLPLLALASCASLSEPPTGARGSSGGLGYGGELQVYPAGVIATARLEQNLGPDEAVSYRVGWNETDREDDGEHDDEEGGGPGVGVGYTRWLEEDRRGWFWGADVDLWQLDIDWRDDSPPEEGSTDVLVLQPTARGGYSMAAGAGWRVDWTVSLGAEINVDTDGEDVGEGAILLLGVRLTSE